MTATHLGQSGGRCWDRSILYNYNVQLTPQTRREAIRSTNLNRGTLLVQQNSSMPSAECSSFFCGGVFYLKCAAYFNSCYHHHRSCLPSCICLQPLLLPSRGRSNYRVHTVVVYHIITDHISVRLKIHISHILSGHLDSTAAKRCTPQTTESPNAPHVRSRNTPPNPPTARFLRSCLSHR